MKERGILFSAPMVKAIQSGAKTQTRREAKNQAYIETIQKTPFNPLCPYGKVGDELWVRETFCKFIDDHVIDSKYSYRADATPLSEEMRLDFVEAGLPYKWTPSIFMPRAASRITLVIMDVHLERLQMISNADAKAEGVSGCIEFAALWKKINGPASYYTDPWVWVVTFKMIKNEKP